jgi:F-type H+-transporting ATPase subunit a
MSPTIQRGCLVFLGLVAFLVACSVLTFGVLPGLNSAPTLPVIVVPGEPYEVEWHFPLVGPWTNTWSATLLVSAIVGIIGGLAMRFSKNWTQEIPGRFQGVIELLGEFIYNQTKNFAGNKPLARNWLYPLAASIFIFLIVANLSKLIPGFETIGVMHCAGHNEPEIGINLTSGHPVTGSIFGYQLYVDAPLKSAYPADEEDYHHCKDYKAGKIAKPDTAAKRSAAAELRADEVAIQNRFEAGEITAAERDAELEVVRLERTESVWPHAAIGLTANALEQGVIPYLQVVTPLFRGATTDLNLPLGLALISFIAIQVFGVAAQGPGYFLKFVNLSALGNLGKKPLGAIDFIVGLLEIISELGKIISLTFRLFGNIFAGGILLAVMSFLVGLILPVIFFGLEIIVGSIQAYVFAVLTIVFSAQAMEGHHGDDEHHDDAH